MVDFILLYLHIGEVFGVSTKGLDEFLELCSCAVSLNHQSRVVGIITCDVTRLAPAAAGARGSDNDVTIAPRLATLTPPAANSRHQHRLRDNLPNTLSIISREGAPLMSYSSYD